MPLEGRVHWTVISSVVDDSVINITLEMRENTPNEVVFDTVVATVPVDSDMPEVRSKIRDVCYLALKRKRTSERAVSLAASINALKSGMETFR